MNARRFLAVILLLWMVGWAGSAIYGAVALPNANVFRVQGPDATGLLGYPVAVVPATGAASTPITGGLTNNNAAPAATNVGVLPGIANATAPTYTEGDQVLLSTDLSGALRTSMTTQIAGEDLANNILRVGSKGGGWCITHAPTAGTQATISKAAGGVGVKNVCTALSVGIVGNTSVPTPTVETAVLRDGAAGGGTILMTWTFVPPATIGAENTINLGGLWIEGSTNTAMTLEFGAGLANTLEFVNISGVTLP